MQSTQVPAVIPQAFAGAGDKNQIPTSSQVGVVAGKADYPNGFPVLTSTPLAAGGIPPSREDMNGILNAITSVLQWQCAGGLFKFDSTFSSGIGGYPKGAILASADNSRRWLNLAENNTTNPDGPGASGWMDLSASGFSGSLSTNGWVRFPFGLIMQWGAASLAPMAGTPIPFNIAFPGGLFTVFITISDSGTANVYKVSATNGASDGFTGVTTNTNNTAIFWLAIGF